MEKYKQYFIDIFKQAATLFQADLEIDEEAEDYLISLVMELAINVF